MRRNLLKATLIAVSLLAATTVVSSPVSASDGPRIATVADFKAARAQLSVNEQPSKSIMLSRLLASSRGLATVADPFFDAALGEGDLYGAGVSTDNLGGEPVLFAGAFVAVWTNPFNIDWEFGNTGLIWRLDLNNDTVTDYSLSLLNSGGVLFADLWLGTSNTHVCTAGWSYDGTIDSYGVAVPLWCLSNPTRVRAQTFMAYDSGFTVSGDLAPNSGWSPFINTDIWPNKPGTPLVTAGPRSLKVAWTAPARNLVPVTDYIVQYAPASSLAWTTLKDPVSPLRSATITGLNPKAKYVVRVRARNATGFGAYSANSLAKQPLPPPKLPAAPGTPTLTPLAGAMRVVWSGPANPVGGPVTDFIVQYLPSNTGVWKTYVDSVSIAHAVTIKGLDPRVSYRVRVRAKNVSGFGPYSAISLSKKPLALPAPPSAPGKPTGSPGLGSVAVTWSPPTSAGASPITDYRVDVSKNGGVSWVTVVDGVSSVPGATITGLAAGDVILVRVAAKSAAGTGAVSPVSNPLSPFNVPGAPGGLSATAVDGGLNLTWTAPVSNGGQPITSYRVDYRLVPDPQVRVQPRIVGGITTTIDQVPWQVAVLPSGNLCGGTLLTTQWVVTAAHCMAGEVPGTVKVHSGLSTLASMTAGNEIAVDEIIVHPAYSPTTEENDLALLHLVTPAAGTPIKLFTDAAGPSAGTAATISGWGTTSFQGSVSDQLRVAGVSVLSGPSGACGSYGTDYKPNVMLCAGAIAGGIDTCQGDSGGPLVIDVAGQPKLAGITSFGNGCAQAAFPGVYTRVSTFAGWIEEQIYPWSQVTVTCSQVAICTSYDLLGLVNGAAYEVRVSATNIVGTGAPSVVGGPFTPATVPDAPTNVAAVAGDASAEVTWDAPVSNGGAAIIDYEISTDGTAWTSTVSATPGTVASGLTNDVPVHFFVRAVNANGFGPASAASADVTPLAPPI